MSQYNRTRSQPCRLSQLALALLISSALLAALDGYTPIMAGIAPLSSWLLGGLGALLLFVSWPTKDNNG